LKPKVQPGTRVAVLGAGSWGTTFAKILTDGGADVVLWARRPELAKEITEGRRNSDYLPGVNLPVGLRATSRLDLALAGAEQVFVSVPSQSLRENLIAAEPFLAPNAILVSLMKGVERSSGLRMSAVIERSSRSTRPASPPSPGRTWPSRSPRSSRPRPWCRPRAWKPPRRSPSWPPPSTFAPT
jgi:glycerol-3-phosphate dehydrogenase (NAD(P)+)